LSDTVGDTEADTGSPVTESNATVLDAVGSERQFYRDSLTGTLREIWRPGTSTRISAIPSPPVALTAR